MSEYTRDHAKQTIENFKKTIEIDKVHGEYLFFLQVGLLGWSRQLSVEINCKRAALEINLTRVHPTDSAVIKPDPEVRPLTVCPES